MVNLKNWDQLVSGFLAFVLQLIGFGIIVNLHLCLILMEGANCRRRGLVVRIMSLLLMMFSRGIYMRNYIG